MKAGVTGLTLAVSAAVCTCSSRLRSRRASPSAKPVRRSRASSSKARSGQAWARARSAWARKLDLRDDPLAALPMTTDRKMLSNQVVLVGYGRVGRHVAATLDRERIHYVVADSNREVVEALRKRGKAAVTGDASDPIVLVQAHITKAAMLVVTIPDPLACRKMVDIARKLNPDIATVLRAESEEGAMLLRKEKLGEVFVAEQELAFSMARYVESQMRVPAH